MTNFENNTAIGNEDILETENEELEQEQDIVEADVEEDDTEGLIRPEGYTGKLISSPLKAIRANCIECCCGNRNEVKLCPSTNCPLWAFRLGKNPYRKGREFSEEEKAQASERFKKLHAEGRIGRKKKDD